MTLSRPLEPSERARRRARIRGLYAVTPDGLPEPDLLERCRAVLAGGTRLLQYRSKSADAPTRARQAQALRDLTRAYGAVLIINDDPALAQACAADGVHLGREDGRASEVLAAYPGLLVGVSCYADLDRACLACASGADYLAFGSVAPSATKPEAVAAPLSLFAAARPLGLPLVAIGGITVANAAPISQAGADALAVISALFDDPDPEAQAGAFAERIQQGKRS